MFLDLHVSDESLYPKISDANLGIFILGKVYFIYILLGVVSSLIWL